MKLVFLEGAGHIRQELLKPVGSVVGRGMVDIVLIDPDVSRQHCRILQAGGIWLVEDLGSVNGVMVNGTRIPRPQILQPGDRLVVGGTELFFLEDLAEPPAALASGGDRPTAQIKTPAVGNGTKPPTSTNLAPTLENPFPAVGKDTKPPAPPPEPVAPVVVPIPVPTTVPALSPRMVRGMLLTNVLVVAVVAVFVGYLAKTVWLPEKKVWVVPTPDNGELLVDGNQPVKGPALLPEKSSLTLKKPGFTELGFSLANPGSLDVVKYVPAPGTVLVTSSPSGATVTLAGKHLGRTPCVLSRLPAGPQLLMVGGQDTHVKPFTVVVNEKTGSTSFVELEPVFATLLVCTTTPGCEISVNGLKVGKTVGDKDTPATLKLDHLYPGTYLIRAATTDGKVKEATRTIEEQQYQQVSIAI